MKTGLFVGTFDPFTIGHDNVVRRVLPLFDRLVIGVVGDNVHKPQMSPAADRMASEPAIEVVPYYGLAVDLARSVGAKYIVKGVRSVKDFEYERDMADVNRRIAGIETILIYAEPQLAAISSTTVRELQHFGTDVSEFLPKCGGER